MLKNQRELVALSAKCLLVWLLLSLLIYGAGETLLSPLLPLFQWLIKTIEPRFLPHLAFVHGLDSISLQLDVRVLRALPIEVGLVIPRGQALVSSTHVLHLLVPIAILFSILSVWPVKNFLERLLLLGLACGFSLLILLAIVPTLLLGVLEMQFQEAAIEAYSQHQVPWFMDWMVFCEMGGSWLLTLIALFICLWLKEFCFESFLFTSAKPKQ